MKPIDINILTQDEPERTIPDKIEQAKVRQFITYEKGMPSQVCLCQYHSIVAQGKGIEYTLVGTQRLCFMCNIAPTLLNLR